MRSGLGILALGALAATSTGCPLGLKRIEVDPAVRDRLSEEREIPSVHYAPVPLRIVRLGGAVELLEDVTGTPALMDLEDPVADVERAFLYGLGGELRLTNVQSSDWPMSSPHVPARGAAIGPLRGVFGRGLVFDFDTIAWQLTFVSRSFIDNSRTTYGVDYAVRARLIRLSDSTVLWQGICSHERGEAPRRWQELEANEFELLKARRAEVANACANDLLSAFTGRTARSTSSGREAPK